MGIMFQGGPGDPPEGTFGLDSDAITPEMMAAIGEGGPVEGPAAAGAGPPGPGGPPSLSGRPTGGPDDALRTAIDSITRYLELEDEDEDIAKAMKHLSGLQDLLAKQQGDMDGLMAGKASPRAMRKAMNGTRPY